MASVLEATKDEAKKQCGESSKEWGDYETRLARAYYYSGDFPKSYSYASDAASTLEAARTPASNRYRANWFAGCAAASDNKPNDAIPYINRAINLTKETDSEWDISDGLKTLYNKLIFCYQSKGDMKKADEIQVQRDAALKAKGR